MLNNKYSEDSIVETILFALDIELKKRRINKKYLNEIKVHKIVYNVADNLDLEITRSWYMRGCYVWCAEPIDLFLNVPEFSFRNVIDHLVKEILAILDDLIDDINVFQLKTSTFLRELYQKLAPSKFRDLYLANLDFKEMYDSFLNQLSSNQRLFFVEADTTEVSSSLSKLHMAITNTIEDNRILDVFIEYTSLLEKVALGLEEKARNDNVNKEMINFAKHVFEVYDNEVWKLPAIEITKQTIKGPRREDVIKSLSEAFNTTLNRVKVLMKSFEDKVAELNLSPSEEFLLEKILPTDSAKAYLRALRDL